MHFSWPILAWLMQCHPNLLTGEQRDESIVFLAAFIACIFWKKKKEEGKEKNHFIYKNHNDVSGY